MNLKGLTVTNLEERASDLEELQLRNYSKDRKFQIKEFMEELKRRQKK